MKSKDNVYFFFGLGAIVLLGFAFLISTSNTQSENSDATSGKVDSAITIENGTQILNLTAKGGYFPQVIKAKADQASILRVKTTNTYDCSLALVIPKLGVRKSLPISGVTDFEISPQPKGSVIEGMCSMNMYRFRLAFN